MTIQEQPDHVEATQRYYGTAVYVEDYDAGRLRWRSKILHREASIRQLDRSGIFPGVSYQLRVPRAEDPETGDVLDVDGDRSMNRFDLYGADSYINTETVTVTGYQPIETEDGRFTGNLVLMRWTQVPYSWVQKEDTERAENIALGERLPDRDRSVLAALRAEAIKLDREKSYHTSVLIPSDGTEVPLGDVSVGLAEIEGLRQRGDKLLLDTIGGRNKNYRTNPPQELTEVYLYHTGEEIADAVLRSNVKEVEK